MGEDKTKVIRVTCMKCGHKWFTRVLKAHKERGYTERHCPSCQQRAQHAVDLPRKN